MLKLVIMKNYNMSLNYISLSLLLIVHVSISQACLLNKAATIDISTSPIALTSLHDVSTIEHDTAGFNMAWFCKDNAKPDGEELRIEFSYHNGSVALDILYRGELSEGLRPNFTLRADDPTLWIYHSGPSKMLNASSAPNVQRQASTIEVEVLPQPLVMSNDEVPQQLTPALAAEELVSLKHVVFYTGAGISAGVVPTMAELINTLGLDICWKDEKARTELIEKMIARGADSIEYMKHFYTQCLHGNPTPAHWSLASLLRNTEHWSLLTENLDMLHERSGIIPLHRNDSDWLQRAVSPEDLKKIDCVVAIGLAQDESSFLAWYKQHNPRARIIAFNLERPGYIGTSDGIVLGDVQNTLLLFVARMGELRGQVKL